MSRSERIAVIGLGYVGLPLAVALAKHFDDVVGFDVNKRRVARLAAGDDSTGEVAEDELKSSRLQASPDPECLRSRTFRAEARRVGEERIRTARQRGAPCNIKKIKN